jgi:hypothetical protein
MVKGSQALQGGSNKCARWQVASGKSRLQIGNFVGGKEFFVSLRVYEPYEVPHYLRLVLANQIR